MDDLLDVDLFVEDEAQERFVRRVIERVRREEQVKLKVATRTQQGGAARVLSDFKAYQTAVEKGAFSPDFVVVVIDGNCSTPLEKRREIGTATGPPLEGRTVVGCPDPHVERWFLADPVSFNEVVGHQPQLGTEKCEKNRYKQLLREALRAGGQVTPLGGIEFAVDLVDAMDFYRAGKAVPSLGSFVEDVRAMLRRAGAGRRQSRPPSRPARIRK